MDSGIDFDALWKLIAAPHSVQTTSIHGPGHWRRVERNGLLLSSRTGANANVVRLFALFHDSQRLNDGYDPEHGARAADFATFLRGKSFDLPEKDFEILHYACTWHTDGIRHDDATISTCWDADRLDLGRVGIIPDPKRMCTDFGREIAASGSVDKFLEHYDAHHSSHTSK
jgi:uncharacterized protein